MIHPAPWAVANLHDHAEVYSREGRVSLDDHETARRVVACVNALQGLHIATIEALVKLPPDDRLQRLVILLNRAS